MVKLVVFDLGGVLVRVTPTWGAALERAGLPASSDLASIPLGAWPSLVDYQAGRLDETAYFELLGGFLGVSREEAERVHAAILVEPVAGTAELVAELHERGLGTACLSNTNGPHWRELRFSGRFPAISALRAPFVSHELGLEKPQPEIYALVESRMNLLPEQILFFDDHAVNVEAARRAGWQAYTVDPEGDPAHQMRGVLAERGLLA